MIIVCDKFPSCFTEIDFFILLMSLQSFGKDIMARMCFFFKFIINV